MVPSRHPLFREKALKQYMQKQEKDILLRPVSPPAFACSWILLCLFLLAALLAWWQEVPTFVEGSGVILAQGQANTTTSDKAVILIFLPATYAGQIRSKLPVRVQIDSGGLELSSTVEHVEPGIISPTEARKRYRLDSDTAQILTAPSIALTVMPKTALPAHTYAGSLVSAQVQIGSRRVLSLLPSFSQLIGN